MYGSSHVLLLVACLLSPQEPSKLLNQSIWGKFVVDLSTVLDELDKRKLTVKAGHSFATGQAGSRAEGLGGPQPMATDGAQSSQNLSVKYLSSSKLFELQVRVVCCCCCTCCFRCLCIVPNRRFAEATCAQLGW